MPPEPKVQIGLTRQRAGTVDVFDATHELIHFEARPASLEQPTLLNGAARLRSPTQVAYP